MRDRLRQFERPSVDRELKKAFVAFDQVLGGRNQSIATGHWGCGVFFGFRDLKFCLQLLAAAQAQRDLVYCLCTEDLALRFGALVSVLQSFQITVGQFYRALLSYPILKMFDEELPSNRQIYGGLDTEVLSLPLVQHLQNAFA